MIHDVDDTVRELLIQKVPIDTNVIDVNFDMPTGDRVKAYTRPTLNLFLYDARENHELRSNQRYLTREAGVGVERRAPVRMDLTYLISAWTTEISDEHQLLGRVLHGLLRHPLLPTEVLKGAMRDQPRPLQAWIAQPERTPNAWDFWGNMEGRMKVSLSYVVTIALEPHLPEQAPLVGEAKLILKETVV